jgi:hypothetical protein
MYALELSWVSLDAVLALISQFVKLREQLTTACCRVTALSHIKHYTLVYSYCSLSCLLDSMHHLRAFVAQRILRHGSVHVVLALH